MAILTNFDPPPPNYRYWSQKLRKIAGVVYGWFPIDQVYCLAFGHGPILDVPILLYQGPEKTEVIMGFFAGRECPLAWG